MTIQVGEKTICKECGAEFRQPYRGNTTIAVKKCPRCVNLKKFQKQTERSKDRIRENRKLLSQSSFSGRNKRTDTGTGKYITKTGKVLKTKKTPKQRARINADDWFSRYIRIKYSYKIVNGEVFCQCFVNPQVIKHAKHMDNGHCFSRAKLSTRYEENNCRPQNRSSNRFSGEADHYTFKDKLREEIGEEKFNELDQLRKVEIEETEEFYLEQAEKYRKLTNQLVRENEIKKWW